MTDKPPAKDDPEDQIVVAEIGVRHDAKGFYVQERAVGAKYHVEYGPMPEESVAPFIEMLKASVKAMGQDIADRQREHLAAMMSPDGLQQQKEGIGSWPLKRKPH